MSNPSRRQSRKHSIPKKHLFVEDDILSSESNEHDNFNKKSESLEEYEEHNKPRRTVLFTEEEDEPPHRPSRTKSERTSRTDGLNVSSANLNTEIRKGQHLTFYNPTNNVYILMNDEHNDIDPKVVKVILEKNAEHTIKFPISGLWGFHVIEDTSHSKSAPVKFGEIKIARRRRNDDQ